MTSVIDGLTGLLVITTDEYRIVGQDGVATAYGATYDPNDTGAIVGRYGFHDEPSFDGLVGTWLESHRVPRGWDKIEAA